MIACVHNDCESAASNLLPGRLVLSQCGIDYACVQQYLVPILLVVIAPVGAAVRPS